MIQKKTRFIPFKHRIHYGGAIINHQEIKAILKTITDSAGYNWTIGNSGTAFEKALSTYTRHTHTILTNSGSSALLLSLLAFHFPKKSYIIIPATTFPTAYSAIIYAGLIPLVIDVKEATYNIDERALETAYVNYGSAIKGIIAVAIAGNIPNMRTLCRIAARHTTKLILDNCDGFGGIYDGRPVESWCDVAVTSFHAAHIITMGEGGAVFTSDSLIARRVRQYRDWGREDGDDEPTTNPGLPADYPRRYSYSVLGLNCKPLELQAAMGLVQFKKLNRFKKIRADYFRKLKDIFMRHGDFFQIINVEPRAQPCWFSFPLMIRGANRADFIQYLTKHNIETRPIFAGNILRHPIGSFGVAHGLHPHADMILHRSLFIGVSPRLTFGMIAFIKKAVDAFVITHTTHVKA